jgi:hypothetical protein
MLGRARQRDRTAQRWPGAYAGTRRSAGPRSFVPLIVVLTLVGVFLGAVGFGQFPGIPSMADLLASWTAQPGDGRAMSRSAPVGISIPSLGVRADTVEVGRAADGSIGTPEKDPVSDAGWYKPGPSPGEAGTAVIVGHVDTASRPAVFSKLADLRRGKLIEVRREDRRTATFVVGSVERFPKTSFPADRVFEETDGKPRLVLVTCGGSWVGGSVGYADNIIVFATLA